MRSHGPTSLPGQPPVWEVGSIAPDMESFRKGIALSGASDGVFRCIDTTTRPTQRTKKVHFCPAARQCGNFYCFSKCRARSIPRPSIRARTLRTCLRSPRAPGAMAYSYQLAGTPPVPWINFLSRQTLRYAPCLRQRMPCSPPPPKAQKTAPT